MMRYDYINKVIKQFGSTSYLEIGVQDGNCYDQIQCDDKTGVDPAANVEVTHPVTSDLFFFENRRRFDVTFIDGLHHCEQVYKDFHNASHVTNHAICLHDVAPLSEDFQTREPTVATWNGDVWKAVLYLKDVHGIVPDWIGREDHCVAVYTNIIPFSKCVRYSAGTWFSVSEISQLHKYEFRVATFYNYEKDFDRILNEFKFI